MEALPPLGERSESPCLSRRSATPDRTWVPSASGRASPAMMQEYGHQIKSDLAPLIQALLTEQPDDTGQFCARYFAESSGEQSGGDESGGSSRTPTPAPLEHVAGRQQQPAWARRKSPSWSRCAPVNAPRTCPKNSLSKSGAGMAPQFCATKGPAARLP